jgi:hypothetical protein
MKTSKDSQGLRVITLLYYILQGEKKIETETTIHGITYTFEDQVIEINRDSQLLLTDLVEKYKTSIAQDRPHLKTNMAMDLAKIAIPERVTMPDPDWTLIDQIRNYLDDLCGCIDCRPEWYPVDIQDRVEKTSIEIVTRANKLMDILLLEAQQRNDYEGGVDKLIERVIVFLEKSPNKITEIDGMGLFSIPGFIETLGRDVIRPLNMRSVVLLYMMVMEWTISNDGGRLVKLERYDPQGINRFLEKRDKYFTLKGYPVRIIEDYISNAI